MVLHEVGELAAILTVACTVFNFIVIKPLRGEIDSLQKSIERLANAVDDIRDKHNELHLRVVAVESRSKSNQHRIDRLEAITDGLPLHAGKERQNE